jgi:hypothetical protein
MNPPNCNCGIGSPVVGGGARRSRRLTARMAPALEVYEAGNFWTLKRAEALVITHIFFEFA